VRASLGKRVRPGSGYEGPEGERRLDSFNLGARWGCVVKTSPRPLYLRERETLLLSRRLGELQGRSGWVRRISPSLGFDGPLILVEAER
jgi:hypothetical protein